ncbi:MAG: hypothetical protein NVS2B12_15060 [Ktedonobacteraceae bacterium]
MYELKIAPKLPPMTEISSNNCYLNSSFWKFFQFVRKNPQRLARLAGVGDREVNFVAEKGGGAERATIYFLWRVHLYRAGRP